MIALWKRVFIFAFCLVMISASAAGQGSLAEKILNPAGTPPKDSAPPDPLGRTTPSGTVFGFLKAAQDGNFLTAAQYLQMSNSRRQSEGEEMSIKLKAVVDRAFVGRLKAISDQPEGAVQEGVRPDQQKIGMLSAGEVEAELLLVRVNDPNGGKIWLVSAETLARVPELYGQIQVHQVETHLPEFFVRNSFLGLALWQWVVLLLSIPAVAGLGWLVIQLFYLPKRLWSRHKLQSEVTRQAVSGPLWLVLSTLIHRGAVGYLGLPLLLRHYYQMATNVALIVGFNWLIWRLVERLLQKMRVRAVLSGRTGTGSLLLLGQRMLKALVFIITIFAVLGAVGFNLTTAFAGLGIGGIAVAFAAQKTLENLFGGVSILGDEVVRVGDVCRFGNQTGTVEDISLRSTRVRTPERIELSIPNGLLATMMVENLTRRDKLLFNPKLGLRYETSADQLRYVLAQIRRMFYEHPRVQTKGARVRFVAFDESALRLEVFCYVLTRDNDEFLAVQEDLLFRIMDIVNASGTGFAFPSTTLYMGKDSGLDAEKTEATHREVKKWRDDGNLPFPDFAPSDIGKFDDSLPYPDPRSAISENNK